MFMKEAAVLFSEIPEDLDFSSNLPLDTLVAAHYLTLQLRMLTRDENFRQRNATGCLAEALSEWARLVEEELFEQDQPPKNVTSLMKYEKH
jgi:hypothetical protein